MPDGSSVSMLRAAGEMIRQARADAGLSQAQVAARVGMTRSSVANLEGGRQDMTISRLALIARVLPALDLNALVALVELPPEPPAPPEPHAVTTRTVLETACDTCGTVISRDETASDARKARSSHVAEMLEKEARNA